MEQRKIKVLVVINSLGAGGAENLLLSIARNIDRRQFELSICSISGNDKLANEFRVLSIQVFRLNLASGFLPGIRFLKAIRGVLHIVRQERMDLLHSHLGYANLVAKIAGRFARIGVISTIHNVIGVERSLYGKVFQYSERYGAFLADAVICVSEGVEKSFFGNPRVFSSQFLPIRGRFFTIHNGVDLAEVDSVRNISRDAIRKKLGLNGDSLTVGIIARLVDWKGHEVLIDAMRYVIDEHPNTKLLIVGKGPLEEKLKQKAKDLNLENCISFLGVRRDVFAILHAIDLFVLPYKYIGLFKGEGVGIAILEAMAFSKPVVTTNVPGISTAMIDRVSGLIVPQGNAYELSVAILELLSNPEQARAIGKAAREIVEEKFSIQRTVRQYESVYQYLCNRQKCCPKL